MLDQLQSLPTTATTEQEFSRQLSQISTQLQTEIEEVPGADADSDELTRERDQLGDRLRSLRTNLNPIQHQVDAGDLDSAKAAIPRLLAIGEIEQSVEKIRSASGGGSG